MAAAFDTLKAATRLREEAGFEERQATVLVELFADRYGDRENLATRDDVAAVRGEVTMLRDDVTMLRGEVTVMRGEVTVLRGDLEKMELTLRGDLEKNDASLRGEIHKLRGDMHKLEQRMTMRLGTVIAAGVAIVVALDKLL
jgi:chromosome segregation ATPase